MNLMGHIFKGLKQLHRCIIDYRDIERLFIAYPKDNHDP
jgi:hypothetical protein